MEGVTWKAARHQYVRSVAMCCTGICKHGVGEYRDAAQCYERVRQMDLDASVLLSGGEEVYGLHSLAPYQLHLATFCDKYLDYPAPLFSFDDSVPGKFKVGSVPTRIMFAKCEEPESC